MNFWGSLLAAVVGGTMSALVAFVVFQGSKRREKVRQASDARRQAVVRMLDVIDRAIYLQTLPPVVRRWQGGETSVILSLSRLMIDLPRSDLAVAEWAATRIQLLALHRSGKVYIATATDLQSRLISWYRGDIDVSWFETALTGQRFDPSRKQPWTRRRWSDLRDLTSDLFLATAVIVLFVIGRDLVLPQIAKFVAWLVRLWNDG